ncbi:MAG: sigma D regulator [Gammaproteobacteria bacterium]|nr:sigma D regulator [Gammaproteobacteria bacterium]MCW8988158.1 sigma D regulator [Gammaproteobacteria bacterium]MCW9032290.1 sigma D regulator [Gammaproteobacteria bacterium]
MSSVNEARTESRQKMDSLLGARKETLSLYSELAALRPFQEEDDVSVVLQEFCETLMDYTASAHFQLYRFIEDGTERRANIRNVAEKVYPNISMTTEQFLDFNDKYEAEQKGQHFSSLDHDLSSLGEILADRILYEDQVITAFTAPKN